MELYGLSGLLAVITSIIIPPLIFINSRKEERLTSGLWVLLNVCITFYGLGILFVTQTADYNTALFWWRVAYIGIVFIPAVYLHHVYKLIGSTIKRWALVGLYSLSFGFFVITQATPQHFFKLIWVFDAFYFPDFLSDSATVNIFSGAFVLLFTTTFSFGIYKLTQALLATAGDRRMQIVLFLVGSVVGYIGGGASYLIDYHINLYPALNFGIPLYHVAIAYAIVRYGLYNTKVITAEMLAAFMAVLFTASLLAPKSLVLMLLLFIGFLFLSTVLVRTALAETRIREELKDLNEHLQQKVDEQTKEIRKAYDTEKRARVELQELDKAKDQFILTTQHHLRTPLTIVKGYLSTLIERESYQAQETKSTLTKASTAVDRIMKLVNEFLDISQIQVGTKTLNRKPTDISTLIALIVEESQQEIEKKRLRVTTSLPEGVHILLDTTRFREALTNVIDNAVKYNKEGGSVAIRGEQTVHPIEKDKPLFKIIVEDTGIGVPPEELPDLFTQYFQRGKGAEKAYTTGKGIGLMLTKNIVEAHGGRIWAESEGLNRGSRFIIEVPLKQ